MEDGGVMTRGQHDCGASAECRQRLGNSKAVTVWQPDVEKHKLRLERCRLTNSVLRSRRFTHHHKLRR